MDHPDQVPYITLWQYLAEKPLPGWNFFCHRLYHFPLSFLWRRASLSHLPFFLPVPPKRISALLLRFLSLLPLPLSPSQARKEEAPDSTWSKLHTQACTAQQASQLDFTDLEGFVSLPEQTCTGLKFFYMHSHIREWRLPKFKFSKYWVHKLSSGPG